MIATPKGGGGGGRGGGEVSDRGREGGRATNEVANKIKESNAFAHHDSNTEKLEQAIQDDHEDKYGEGLPQMNESQHVVEALDATFAPCDQTEDREETDRERGQTVATAEW
jgi:hypothetical protein